MIDNGFKKAVCCWKPFAHDNFYKFFSFNELFFLSKGDF